MGSKTAEKELVKSEFYQDILHHKKVAESQFVLSLYSNPDQFYEYKITRDVLSDPAWKLYYEILNNILKVNKLKIIDVVAVEEYVQSKSEKLQEYYELNGGFNTIKNGVKLVQSDNIDVFYSELRRYNVILKLVKLGYPVKQNWDKFSKMPISDLSDYMESQLNSAFIEADFSDDQVVDILDGIEGMVEKADSGIERGLPLNSNLMNSIQNGMALGNITMLAANSGVGKTFLTLNQLLPTHILFKEPLMIIANEEDIGKWQKELLTWQINNIQKKTSFNKERFYQGKFTIEEKEHLSNAVEWLKEQIDNDLIKFVNLNDFSMNKTVKLIKKYASGYGFKYFVVDTLKLDNDSHAKITDNSWLQLQQNMVKLYNVIKPSNKNCHVWVTYQMSKNPKGKYLSQNDLGMSKNVADVVSSLILIRLLSESEKGESSSALKVKNKDGNRVTLDEDKDYFVAFWDKNRQGSSSEQAILRVDRGKNKVRDIGKVRISPEYS